MISPSASMNSVTAAESELVGRIWAAKKIGFLVDEIRLQGETDERIEAIVELGTRFGILTEYTAFLAAEDVDLWALEANKTRCSLEIEGRAGIVTGAHGVAQACNSKALQRNDQVTASNSWFDENGNRITLGGVQCVAGKAFFRRDGAWQDSATNGAEPDQVVALFSDPFYALLDQHPWLGRCVARTGEVTVEVAGKTVRITAAS